MFLGQFQGNPKFLYFGNTYSHHEGPGVLRESLGHGLGQGVDHDHFHSMLKLFLSFTVSICASLTHSNLGCNSITKLLLANFMKYFLFCLHSSHIFKLTSFGLKYRPYILQNVLLHFGSLPQKYGFLK